MMALPLPAPPHPAEQLRQAGTARTRCLTREPQGLVVTFAVHQKVRSHPLHASSRLESLQVLRFERRLYSI
jgi:hypothetical protein